MADHHDQLPLANSHDDIPRGGRWARWIAISVALILAVAYAPQTWKIPLGALSILTLLVGVGMLMMGGGGGGRSREQRAESRKQ